MEDVPAGHGQRRLDVDRRGRLQAGAPVRVAGQAVEQRLLQVRVELRHHPADRLRPRALRVGPVELGGRVQAEQRQRVVPGGPLGRAQDRRVAQRVAVDLERDDVGQPRRRRPARRRRRAGSPASSTWNVPANAVAGSAPERSRGSRASTMLTFSCEPEGRRPGIGAGQLGQHGGRRAADHVRRRRPRARSPSSSVQCDRDAVGARVEGGHRGPGDQLRAVPPGGRGHRAADRAHAADRHPPLAGPVADQVVQEAAAGQAVGGVDVGEGADQPVGERDPADDVVGEVVGDDVGQRPLAQVVPQVGVAQPGRESRGGEQRLDQRGREVLGEGGQPAVEALPARRTRRRSR